MSTKNFCIGKIFHIDQIETKIILLFIVIDAIQIAKKHKFDLSIPKYDEVPDKNFRIYKKAFAIICYSKMTSKILFLTKNLQ